jgi:hypothetical protein
MAAPALAKERGLTVLSTTRRPDRFDVLREIGVDHPIVDDGEIAQKVLGARAFSRLRVICDLDSGAGNAGRSGGGSCALGNGAECAARRARAAGLLRIRLRGRVEGLEEVVDADLEVLVHRSRRVRRSAAENAVEH